MHLSLLAEHPEPDVVGLVADRIARFPQRRTPRPVPPFPAAQHAGGVLIRSLIWAFGVGYFIGGVNPWPVQAPIQHVAVHGIAVNV
jgi:hypothetical protein